MYSVHDWVTMLVCSLTIAGLGFYIAWLSDQAKDKRVEYLCNFLRLSVIGLVAAVSLILIQYRCSGG